ncbi:hypothetical protein QLX08_011314 [Tetragonisca angustula]|uniref:Uncharacterized protein n=1 Tax=Tetragonisca angustula TaxID=166442 RepID=A0AAW0Z8I7_9HYME
MQRTISLSRVLFRVDLGLYSLETDPAPTSRLSRDSGNESTRGSRKLNKILTKLNRSNVFQLEILRVQTCNANDNGQTVQEQQGLTTTQLARIRLPSRK